MVIRYAEKIDIPKWQRLADEVADLFDSPNMGSEPSFINYIKSKINKNEALAAIDENSGDLSGVIGFSRKNNRISWFAVKKEFRGKGTGSALLSKALAQMDKNKDISVITFSIDCMEGRPAIEIYKNFGFIIAVEAMEHEGHRRCKMIKYADNK